MERPEKIVLVSIIGCILFVAGLFIWVNFKGGKTTVVDKPLESVPKTSHKKQMAAPPAPHTMSEIEQAKTDNLKLKVQNEEMRNLESRLEKARIEAFQLKLQKEKAEMEAERLRKAESQRQYEEAAKNIISSVSGRVSASDTSKGGALALAQSKLPQGAKIIYVSYSGGPVIDVLGHVKQNRPWTCSIKYGR